MVKNNKIGKFGEQIAYVYLKQKGYVVLDYNVFSVSGEIDIIALWRDTLVCVEVKTTTSKYQLSPESAVDGDKKANILATFREKLDYFETLYVFGDTRFDVIGICLDLVTNKARIRHYTDVIIE